MFLKSLALFVLGATTSALGSKRSDYGISNLPADSDHVLRRTRNDDDLAYKGTVDKHGCRTDAGEYYCFANKKCVSDWDDCDLGYYNSDTNKCSFIYNNSAYSFSYSLASYSLPRSQYYLITDDLSHKGEEFKYYFNICKHVEPDTVPKVCLSTKGSASETCEGNALAYQYHYTKHSESCFRMSDCNHVRTTDKTELGLIDPLDPAAGVYVKYYGGNSCQNTYADSQACDDIIKKKDTTATYCGRSFRLNIKCDDSISKVAKEEVVQQGPGCAYSVTISHKMGCPVECPRNKRSRSVCSGHGSCIYSGHDSELAPTLKQSKGLQCVCNKGRYGSACEYYSSFVYYSEASGVPVWLLVLLYIAIIGALIYGVYYKREIFVLLLRGDFAAVFPGLFGRRMASDGKGFYARVGEVSRFGDGSNDSNIRSQAFGEGSKKAGGRGGDESFTL